MKSGGRRQEAGGRSFEVRRRGRFEIKSL